MRVPGDEVFGIWWEVSGTEDTVLMDGERFGDRKPDRGFKTLFAGSQIPQLSAFFPFDFTSGGLGHFDVKVSEMRNLIDGICGAPACYPNFAFGLESIRIVDAMER